MKTIYETFEQLANAMCKGGGALHAFNCPYGGPDRPNDDCISWQRGVRDFAGWLDHIGVKVEVSDTAETFYEYMSRERPTIPIPEEATK